MPIPTEPIGSIPRLASLIEAQRDLDAGRISRVQWRARALGL
jgi:methionine synthase II (cobalamin-independent)